jgi:hypothetical protein
MMQEDWNRDLPTTATRVLPLCCTTIYNFYEALIYKYEVAQPGRDKMKKNKYKVAQPARDKMKKRKKTWPKRS